MYTALLIKMNFIYKTCINNPIDPFQLKQQHTMSKSYVKLQFYVYYYLTDSIYVHLKQKQPYCKLTS